VKRERLGPRRGEETVKILVTGGAGYIGSVLVPKLLTAGHRVTVLDSFLYGQTSLLDCCRWPTFTVVRGDVRDTRLLDDLVPRADVILPLACLTGAPICERDPQTAEAVNLLAIRAISERMGSGQRLIFPTTNSGYGIGQSDIHCDEDTPLRPISTYGRLKVEAEALLLDRGDCVTFRFATLFGVSPRMRLDLLVNDFTYRAVVDRFVVLFEAHFKRNYLHVLDAARAFLHGLEHYELMKGRPYNVGLSDANLSKWELCEAIRRHVPGFVFLASEIGKDPDQRNYVVSNDRIEATGFKPGVSLDEGIAELVKAYQILRRSEHANA
jgi:nucleoside-diphosphate-sugar epimerase